MRRSAIYSNIPSHLVLIDLAILISVLEGLMLLGYHYFSGKGLAPNQYLLNLTSGLCLMVALRLTVNQFNDLPLSGLVVPLFLLVSGVTHWLDLYQRWHEAKPLAA